LSMTKALPVATYRSLVADHVSRPVTHQGGTAEQESRRARHLAVGKDASVHAVHKGRAIIHGGKDLPCRAHGRRTRRQQDGGVGRRGKGHGGLGWQWIGDRRWRRRSGDRHSALHVVSPVTDLGAIVKKETTCARDLTVGIDGSIDTIDKGRTIINGLQG
jgi:hypothetical protein